MHLSRELARRGHTVEHQFCTSYTTGRGATERREGDPRTFSVRALDLGGEFARYSPLVRLKQELRYAPIAARAVCDARPDVAVLSNIPLLSLFLLAFLLRRRGVPYVFWQQDVYSDAIGVVARQKLRGPGAVVAWLAARAERSVARGAAGIVPISDTFLEQLDRWGVARSKVRVVPNWGAIDEMPVRPRRNPWATAHGLTDVPVVMYAGTLGLKHDPSVLARLAQSVPDGSRVVVVSQGQGREWLETNAADVESLALLDYQPYEQLPDMLASADVLIVVLEQDASRYSVPSKVLNYFCAGRPVLGLLPGDNAVAHMIESAGAGIVCSPADMAAASTALNDLLADPEARERMGNAARDYAEKTFDVAVVGDLFESVVSAVYDLPSHLLSNG
ncbi:glycosyltransferase family 4 protein [Mycobacterium sp. IDR2000157661]|uniref:glycosyltransferase family 4 protein n=1 Tax=Mycobacterium sp. IDR2000157661 TaxID=2867005 RepID=UPI001EED14FB|nr:glycosyltransferase family 4 protein [Mycobacterium sp. IDR2000157661]